MPKTAKNPDLPKKPETTPLNNDQKIALLGIVLNRYPRGDIATLEKHFKTAKKIIEG